MSLPSFLQPVLVLFAAMAALALLEAILPLRTRTAWSGRHLAPNIALTLITVATNAAMNIPLLIALAWFQREGWGLFNVLELPAWAGLLGAVVVLDLAWYVTHRSLHQTPWLWRLHAVHHSDPIVDVTTAIRQHPGEGLVRYAFLLVFGLGFGVSPAGFVLYRIWSALQGQFDHANVRLPLWLDEAICWVTASPNMHKVHHAQDARLTDTNYSSILSVWDRLFGTFTPPRQGLDITYGLEGHEGPHLQTLTGLLRLPFSSVRPQAAVSSGADA
jgi:sterol desaturase/sphingolipid hydroxylase (fatty acid hydroxylase superfamily)